MQLIDDGRPDSFSMRQLADALGVGVMTIYGYVQNKKELYEAVFELAFSEVSAPPTDECEWYELVRATVGELYTLCRRHPNLISIALTAQLKPALFSRRARILDALEGADFPRPVALRALGTLVSYTIVSSFPGAGRSAWFPTRSTTGSSCPPSRTPTAISHISQTSATTPSDTASICSSTGYRRVSPSSTGWRTSRVRRCRPRQGYV